MRIRATILAGVLGLPLLAGAALAADAVDRSLVEAARQGDREAVRSLLNDGKGANVASSDGTSALFWAASRNDAQMVDMLLRARADVNATNDYGAKLARR